LREYKLNSNNEMKKKSSVRRYELKKRGGEAKCEEIGKSNNEKGKKKHAKPSMDILTPPTGK
jgi:hypothetical protein